MATEAVSRAKRIGVLATPQTTLVPAGNLVRATAADHKKECQIIEKLTSPELGIKHISSALSGWKVVRTLYIYPRDKIASNL